MDLEYAGCTAHTFSMGWSGAVATSEPARVLLELNHYPGADACKELLTSKVVIDLRGLDAVAPAWIELLSARGRALEGATAALYEGSGEITTDAAALSVRRECSHFVP